MRVRGVRGRSIDVDMLSSSSVDAELGLVVYLTTYGSSIIYVLSQNPFSFFATAYNISYTPLNALHLLSDSNDDQLDSVIAVLVDQDLVLPRRRLRSRERARSTESERAITGLPYIPDTASHRQSNVPFPRLSFLQTSDSRRRTPKPS